MERTDADAAELIALLERVGIALEDTIEQLESWGLSYARKYAATLYSSSPPRQPSWAERRPVGMDRGLNARLGQLVREIVIDELQRGHSEEGES